jgi:hypothetical protein
MRTRILGLCTLAWCVAPAAFAAGGDSPFTTRLVKAASGEPGIDVSFALPEMQTAPTADGFVAVDVKGLQRVNEAGAPDVPTAGIMIAIPDGFEPRLTLKNVASKAIDAATVQPFRRKFRCVGDKSLDAANVVELNDSIYSGDAMWPRENVRLEDVGVMQGVRLARLAVYPVQFDPFVRGMNVTTSFDARVDFVPTSDKAAKPTQVSQTFKRLLEGTTINAKASRNLRAAVTPERMLVVTTDALKPELNEFLAWKRAKGLIVDVATYTEAGGSTDAVKRYVQAYYDRLTPKPTYLLLVGNGSTMPPFRRSTSSGSAASDYPFSLLSGTDIVPDMIVGRLLADDATMLRNQVQRWIAHERNPETTDAAWYAKGTTIASSEGSGPSDVEYAQQVEGFQKGGTYTDVDHFYEGEGSATATNIVGALAQGRSWLTYIGHGSGTSWGSTNTTFSTTTIRSMSNARLPVIVDVACDNGSFVDISNCFGKVWVTHMANGKAAGAVGYWGASVSTSWDPPAVMAVGIAKRHYERSLVALGASLIAGQIYLMEEMGTGSDVVDNFEWYNLLGDPSLVMRTAAPAGFELTYAEENGEATRDLTVRVDNTDGSGKAGVQVALVAADGYTLHGIVATDESGRATFQLPSGTNLSGAKLTAGGYNLVTQEVTIH